MRNRRPLRVAMATLAGVESVSWVLVSGAGVVGFGGEVVAVGVDCREQGEEVC
jgi:hypothetical protein